MISLCRQDLTTEQLLYFGISIILTLDLVQKLLQPGLCHMLDKILD